MENCLAKIAGIAGKKFDGQFGERLKLGNHEDSTCRTMLRECVDRKEKRHDEMYPVTEESVVVVSPSPFSGIQEGFRGTFV